MKKQLQMPCGRTEEIYSHLCCTRKHTLWNQRVKLGRPTFYWDRGLRMNVPYKKYCRKCGHLIEMGNKFRLIDHILNKYEF